MPLPDSDEVVEGMPTLPGRCDCGGTFYPIKSQNYAAKLKTMGLQTFRCDGCNSCIVGKPEVLYEVKGE